MLGDTNNKHIPPNILTAMRMRFDMGDPMDYTWVDLGEFETMSDAEYKRVMQDIPNPFHCDPVDALLPFEKMGFVRRSVKYEKGAVLAVTMERGDDGLMTILRTTGGDAGGMLTKATEQLVHLPERLAKNPQAYIETLRKSGLPGANSEGLDPRTYLYKIWSGMVAHQYAEYMRKAQDMHERTRAFKAAPSAKDAAINAKRIRKGKQPLYDWSVIDVTAKQKDADVAATGTARTSPRQHTRRGHFRHFKDGRKVWIKEMLVGKIEFGYTYHSYTTGG